MKRRELSANMKSLQTRLDSWRKKQNGVVRSLPQDLWDEAVQIAKIAGVGPTAYALRLNSNRLQTRLQKAASLQVNEEASATFVEVKLPRVSPKPKAGQMSIEFTKAHGERMRIESATFSMTDVMGLAKSFWSYGT